MASSEDASRTIIGDSVSYQDLIRQTELSLEYALETRRFEIGLYWQRTAYFWAIIGASFAAFFALMSAEKVLDDLVFIVTCVGLVLSLAWYLVNRGSKYWQENWERHVDLLEENILGGLFKTTISRQQFKFRRLSRGFPYSVSRLNQIVSLYVASLWLLLVCWRAYEAIQSDQSGLLVYIMATITAVSCIWLLLSFSSPNTRMRDVSFDYAPLRDTSEVSENGS